MTVADALCAQRIRENLRAKILGNRIEVLLTVDSTNSRMKGMDLSSTPEGLVLLAEAQTGGRGRKNRLFHSPAGQGIYMSLLLKPKLPPEDTRFLTVCASLAVCEALESVCGVRPGIKWVNDVWCGGKKLCGILTEGSFSADSQAANHVVVGIGINTGEVRQEVRDLATSVSSVSGKETDRNALAAELLNRMEARYLELIDGRKKELIDEYRNRLFIVGRTVDVLDSNGSFRALVTGIDEEGALTVRDESGEVLRLCSEEISLRLEPPALL